MRRAWAAWAPILLLCWSGTVGAQERRAELLPPVGTDVRVWYQTLDQEQRHRGVLSFRSPSEVGLRSRGGVEYRIPIEDLSRLDRSGGRSHARGALKGFGLGAGIGFVALGIFAAAAHDSSTSPCDSPGCTDSAGGAFLIGGIVGGVVGAPIGGVIGLARGSQRWERVF